LADIAANAKRGRIAPPIPPLALEAVKRIDALFDIERAIDLHPVWRFSRTLFDRHDRPFVLYRPPRRVAAGRMRN
jgi:hypothetical protein